MAKVTHPDTVCMNLTQRGRRLFRHKVTCADAIMSLQVTWRRWETYETLSTIPVSNLESSVNITVLQHEYAQPCPAQRPTQCHPSGCGPLQHPVNKMGIFGLFRPVRSHIDSVSFTDLVSFRTGQSGQVEQGVAAMPQPNHLPAPTLTSGIGRCRVCAGCGFVDVLPPRRRARPGPCAA